MIYSLILYIALIAGGIPMLLFLVMRKDIVCNKAIIPIIALIAFSSIYEYVVIIQLQMKVTHWYQIHSLFEFLAVFYLFKNLITQRPRWFFIIGLGLFLVVYILSFIYLNNEMILVSKSLNKSYMTLFVISCSFLLVKQVFDQKLIMRLYQGGTFFIVMGLFFYYSTTISLFVLSNYLYKSELFFYDYWLVNIIASLILRILLSIGVWKMN